MSASRLPAVLKIGHAHGGLGKLKVESPLDFQDAASVVAVSNSYWYSIIVLFFNRFIFKCNNKIK